MDKEMLKGSHLLFWLNKLNIVSKESTNSGFDFDSFNKYMHVNREIQDDLIQTISTINSRSENHLIFFAGSSGDGKSHTFSYLRENHEELIEEYEFYRDATESDDLDLEAEEVLEKKLIEFSDDKVMTNTGSKTIIAINLGILSNLIMVPTVKKNYSKMVNFVHESGVLEEGSTKRVVIGNNFSIVNFSGYNDLDFLEEELIYLYLEQIFEKVFSENENNIFYNAYKNDIDN